MTDTVTIQPGVLDIDESTLIAVADSEAPGKPAWTRLSLWYRQNPDRPFVAVVEGLVRPGSGMKARIASGAFGSLERAIAWFEASQLRDTLVANIPANAAELYPDGNAIRARLAAERRAERSYQGSERLTDMLAWLYPDMVGASDNALAKRFEEDFCVGSRTTRSVLHAERAGAGRPPGWGKTFCRVLRFFDRRAWEASRG